MLPYESRVAVQLLEAVLAVKRPNSSRIGKLRLQQLREFSYNPGLWSDVYKGSLTAGPEACLKARILASNPCYFSSHVPEEKRTKCAHILLAWAVHAALVHDWKLSRYFLELVDAILPILKAA